ncbi:HTH-type transcriptional regulator CysL [Fusobacterium sp. DD29]|uniref:LysR family transcriptional regulator n=1 Tax=unclassified Fusobacterium TaxID=2648384 RepID=UPI001B8B5321|nr:MULTISPECIES: LysR family transcriptional regulator [unclassified Fusobacterium]MBR8702304.1 HTH-type transcriptional regulator CysL [Fusobacterium sp. DD45]MBR8712121.1 HTH-type transcriptional regulator CysL [Fusobacterium sp. DD28]MBR8750037.1 HTH-type transcriptional regulator CysL [Fusobacterium sp. DD29]MBR8752700.1 HTH-type transcriptional regulator CysL [Fusobacterium sp. DD26]MBR8762283.1 HTH-type transcriptional regulator CysL [Fusobacterium sp. DD25]
MLDFRVNTFIELCKTRNYTKTAENLHMTQPAVTQHIKHLEEFYQCKLFNYNKKVLTMTEQGKILYKYLLTLSSDSKKIQEEITELGYVKRTLHFGATLTIGEYAMPKIMEKLSIDYPDVNINFMIRDTRELLEELKNGNIEFALIEGFFEKTDYESIVFAKETFVGVCSVDNPIAQKKCSFEDLLSERLILREAGSGSRDIFEKILYENNLSISNFKKKYEIENINVIKELVKKDVGISFLYKKAIEDDLKAGQLAVIDVKNSEEEREFNFVFMKNSFHKKEYKQWFNIMKKIYNTYLK